MILVQGDISSAFLHGRFSSPVFFYLPQGHPLAHRKDLVYRSEAAVYGLKESGRIWYQLFSNFLCSICFKESLICPGLFVWRPSTTNVVYLCLYVDVFIIASASQSLIDSVMRKIKEKFSAKG